MERKEFEKKLEDWKEKVLKAYDSKDNGYMIYTFDMVADIDSLIAEAFGHDPIIEQE